MSNELHKKISLLNKQALSQMRNGNPQSSIVLLKEAEVLSSPAYIPRPLKTLTFFSLASYYQTLGHRLQSLRYLEKILKITQDRPTLAKAHLNIGFILSLQSLHQQSLLHNTKALSYLENTEEFEGKASAYHSIGLEYQCLSQYSRSMAAFKQGFILSKLHLGLNHKLTRILRNCLLENSKYVKIPGYMAYDMSTIGSIEINQIVSELEAPLPRRFTPLPKYLKSKNSSPLPNKPVLLSKSVQFDTGIDKGIQCKFDYPSNQSSIDKPPNNNYTLQPIPNRTKVQVKPKNRYSLITEKDYENIAVKIQKNFKMWTAVKSKKLKIKAIKTIQNWWKTIKQLQKFRKLLKKIKKIQSVFRGFRVRKLYKFLLSDSP